MIGSIFDRDTFQMIVSDWDVNSVYIDNVCVLSHNSDCQHTLDEYFENRKTLKTAGCSVDWTDLRIVPCKGGCVDMYFTTKITMWKDYKQS